LFRTAQSIVTARLAVLLAATCLLTASAQAGEWVRGGTYDAARGVAVYFLRFLAGPGEGQMTIRCNGPDGLWIDAGVAGVADLPPSAVPGAVLGALFTFVRADATRELEVAGELIVRADGAAIISIAGAAADPIGRELLLMTERLDITIGAVTRPVQLDNAFGQLQNLAAGCTGWPGMTFELR
jgi:hypothetical protein